MIHYNLVSHTVYHKVLLLSSGEGRSSYLLDGLNGVVPRHREFEEDPSGQQEVHHDPLVPLLLLPVLLHPILPRGHGDGCAFTVSSSTSAAAQEKTYMRLICPAWLDYVPTT